MKKTSLVVMAAGMGSRFGGLKQLEPIGPNGEAILDFSVYDAINAGFDEVIFVIKRETEKDFKNIVGKRIENSVPVRYAFQEISDLPPDFSGNTHKDRIKPWGTGHAILSCRNLIDSPFAVINADDFYGASAFEKIHNSLIQDDDDYSMVGYKLKNTVTSNGDVSRGVCEVHNGKLSNIIEYTGINYNCVSINANGETISLSPDSIVSMNLWGFKPDIFKYLETEFYNFLMENHTDLKAEFYLPSVIDTLIKSNMKCVNVLIANEKWYGITYREDKKMVVDAVNNLIRSGRYKKI